MHKRFGILMAVALVVIAALLVVNSALLGGPGLQAQTAAPTSETTTPGVVRAITVVGEGTVRIEPDIAYINIGVETVGESVREATQEADAIVVSIMDALEELGVAEKDMQTSGFSVWTDRSREPGMLATEATETYRVNNTLNITIRDLEDVSTVIDAAIDEGANNIHGVRFSLANPDPSESEARALAIENALEKAEELAELNNVAVGQVLSVSEVIGGSGGYLDSNFNVLESAKLGLGGGSITPGELELAVRLQVVYAIR